MFGGPLEEESFIWDATSGVAEILNKPDLGVTQITAGTNIAIDPVAGDETILADLGGKKAPKKIRNKN